MTTTLKDLLREGQAQAEKRFKNTDHMMYQRAIRGLSTAVGAHFLDLVVTSIQDDVSAENTRSVTVPYLHDAVLYGDGKSIDVIAVWDNIGGAAFSPFRISWNYSGEREGAFYAHWQREDRKTISKPLLYKDKTDGQWYTDIKNLKEITLSELAAKHEKKLAGSL